MCHNRPKSTFNVASYQPEPGPSSRPAARVLRRGEGAPTLTNTEEAHEYRRSSRVQEKLTNTAEAPRSEQKPQGASRSPHTERKPPNRHPNRPNLAEILQFFIIGVVSTDCEEPLLWAATHSGTTWGGGQPGTLSLRSAPSWKGGLRSGALLEHRALGALRFAANLHVHVQVGGQIRNALNRKSRP